MMAEEKMYIVHCTGCEPEQFNTLSEARGYVMKSVSEIVDMISEEQKCTELHVDMKNMWNDVLITACVVRHCDENEERIVTEMRIE